MADKRKITVEVDDEALKKYSKEEQEALKQNTAKLKEEEARKTATVKAQLNERYANLKAALQKELIAVQGGKELVIKEAIAQRKVMESELRTYEATYRNILSKELAEFKATKQAELQAQRQFNQSITNAPRTNLKGAIGSESYVRQIQSSQAGMLPGSQEFIQSGLLIEKYKGNLKTAGVEVKSLSQKIGGELNGALVKNNRALMDGATNFIKFNLTLAAITIGVAKFWSILNKGADLQVTSNNFKGTTADLEAFRTASANTVTDASLEKLSSQATDLGISLKDQAILFSLAETAGDKYGGSIEENFTGLMNSTEGAEKVLKSLGIQKKVYEEAIKSLLPVGAEQLDQLDAEAQKQIRVQALLKVTGETYQDATTKLMDNKDMLESISISYENFQAALGEKAVEMFSDTIKDATTILNNFGISTDSTTGFLGKFTSMFISHLDILVKVLLPWTNLIGLLKTASEKFSQITKSAKDTNTVLGNIINTLSKAVPTPLIDGINEALRFAQEEARAFLKLLGLITANEGNNDAMGVTGDAKGDRGKKGTGFIPPIKNTGSKNGTGKTDIDEQTNSLKGFNAELEHTAILYKQIAESASQGALGANPRYKNLNLKDLNPRQRDIENLERSEKLTNAMLTGFESMNNFVGSMLQKTGLMDTDFGKIVQMIQSIIGVGKEAFSFAGLIGDIISLFPGGSVIGGAVGGGARAGNFSMSGNRSQPLSVNVYGTLSGQKFLSDEIPVYNYKQGQKH